MPILRPEICYGSQLQLLNLASCRRGVPKASFSRRAVSVAAAEKALLEEADIDGMSHFLDSLKWDANGLVAVIVQVGISPSHMALVNH